MPYIRQVRTEWGATAGAENCRKYERNERYDRVQAIYYPILIGRDAFRRFSPVLGECVTTDHHMYRMLLHGVVRCSCSIRDQTISDPMPPSWAGMYCGLCGFLRKASGSMRI